MNVGYSEKQYEFYFNSELIKKYGANRDAYAPSQTKEKELGFDVAHIINPFFLNSIARSNALTGKNIRQNNGKIPSAPLVNMPSSYRANLFIQFKKPEYLTTHRAAQYHLFGGPYLRYDIYQEQLDTLINLNTKFIESNSHAYIIYASSTAKNTKELQDQCINETIIEESSLAEVSRLINHRKVVYENATHFIACSEPEYYGSESIKEILENTENETSLKDTLKTLELFLETNVKYIYELYFNNFKQNKNFDSMELTDEERQTYSIEWISNSLGLSWGIIASRTD